MFMANVVYQDLGTGRFTARRTGDNLRTLPNFSTPKTWATPLDFYEQFIEYAEFCKNNPLIQVDYMGKNADYREIPKMRAMTVLGFCRFCDTSNQQFYSYAAKDDYREVAEFIKTFCSGVNIEGAAGGLLNSALIMRLEGLVDKKEITGNNVTTVRFCVPTIEAPLESGDEDLIEGDDWSLI